MSKNKKIKNWDKERHQDLVFEFVGRAPEILTEKEIELLKKLKERTEAGKS